VADRGASFDFRSCRFSRTAADLLDRFGCRLNERDFVRTRRNVFEVDFRDSSADVSRVEVFDAFRAH
ncbi:hypothetical protein ACFRQM_51360, partial [Streptomyces sp. NPDC056831]|uniref:hypothetical protein n=1 Tax=Streptomyces sp. NPDC056831 TaxID=3345954 RepID=UPI0036B0EF5E